MTASQALWLDRQPLVLASGSAARRGLLEGAGIPLVVHPAEVDERAIEAGLVGQNAPPEVVAMRLAEAKALAVSVTRPGEVVLGADQTLSLDGTMFHKPGSIERAAAHLQAFSGRTHQLFSAAVIAQDGVVRFSTLAWADLSVRPLTSEFIAAYLTAAGQAMCSSVGAYQLEGLGIHLFDAIQGDQPTIMGLPLLRVLEGLRELGLVRG